MTPPTRTTERRAAIIYNPVKIDRSTLHPVVAAAEKEHGWGASLWLETTEEEPGAGLARRAVAEGVEVVLAAGGDGTVRAVADGLGDSRVALALLPQGTGNLLARNLNLDLTNLDVSVHTAFTGENRDIDLGLAKIVRPDGTTESHAFVVMAGIGLDAKMIANTNPELKKRVGWLAYVDAIARSLRDTEQLRINYRADGGDLKTMRAHTVLVGNCGTLPGNILLLPDAELDDGVFDIVTLRPEGFFGWAQIWVKIVWENGVLRRSSVGRKLAGMTREVRTLRYLKASTFDVQLDRAEEFELDGDEFGMVTAFRTEVEGGALTVRVPATESRERQLSPATVSGNQPSGPAAT